MALLFVVGVMNLGWIAAIAVVVLLEKAVPAGRWLSRIGGVGFIGSGISAPVVTVRSSFRVRLTSSSPMRTSAMPPLSEH